LAKYPYFPIWVNDLIADCHHLSNSEFGLYHRILYAMWRAPRGRIPNDDVWLSRHLNCTIPEVSQYVRPLILEFCASSGNWITQKRLQHQLQRVRRTSEKQSVRAKSRIHKEITSSHGTSHGSATGMPVKRKLKPKYNGSVSEVLKTSLGNGHSGNGKYADPGERDQWAVNALVSLLPGADAGEQWALMIAAETPTDPTHEKACRAVREVAKANKIGWVSPHLRTKV
jgi:uncharacterized protein YdaU (DUF1376 family)